jgi:hypothetical protein
MVGTYPPKMRLGPEDMICIEFANTMRKLTLEGRSQCVWGHIPNEGKRSYIEGFRIKCLGRIPGAADYFFVKLGDTMFIEFKSLRGAQSPSQKDWEKWCRHYGIKYFVAKSPEKALQLLEAFGFITPKQD